MALLADIASHRRDQRLEGHPPPPNPIPPTPTAGTLTLPGPYSPMASLPTKTVKRILNLEFLEMSEVTGDDLSVGTSGRPPPPRLPITDISQWVQRYSTMAAIIASRFPHKAAELFAYQAQIVRAARNYEGDRWVAYDRQFRREALTRKDLDWSVMNHRLYNEAFTGWARSIARCTICLQDDHKADQCPRNPNHSLLGWLQEAAMIPSSRPRPTSSFAARTAQPYNTHNREVCKRYNRGRCPDQGRCRYRHACLDCQGDHPYSQCPKLDGSTRGLPMQSRSPFNRRGPNQPQP